MDAMRTFFGTMTIAVGSSLLLTAGCGGAAASPEPKAAADASPDAPPRLELVRRPVDEVASTVADDTGVPIAIDPALEGIAACTRVSLRVPEDARSGDVVRALRDELESTGLTLVLQGDGWLLARHEGQRLHYGCFEELDVAELNAWLIDGSSIGEDRVKITSWARDLAFLELDRLLPGGTWAFGEDDAPVGFVLSLGPKHAFAKALGLRDGDIVRSVAGIEVHGATSFAAMRRAAFATPRVRIELLRDEEDVALEIWAGGGARPDDETASGDQDSWVETTSYRARVHEFKRCPRSGGAAPSDLGSDEERTVVGVDIEIEATLSMTSTATTWLTDDGGSRHLPVRLLSSCGTALPENAMAAGDSKRGWLFFEVPARATELSLTYWAAIGDGRSVATVSLDPLKK